MNLPRETQGVLGKKTQQEEEQSPEWWWGPLEGSDVHMIYLEINATLQDAVSILGHADVQSRWMMRGTDVSAYV